MRKVIIALIIGIMLAGQASSAGAAAIVADYKAAPAKEADKRQKSPRGKAVVATAQKYKGVPYRYGGATPKGFDCSGFTMYVFSQHGVKLPRAADKQYAAGKRVARNDLRCADLVFFTTTDKGASHCGIYMGDGKFIHASSSRGVMVSSFADEYWKPRYLGARRVL